jgi:serine/threonine protein kinase
VSDNPKDRTESLPVSVARHLDRVCNRFEDVWRAGQRPSLPEFLVEADEPARLALLRELLCLDVEYRREAGEQPTLEDYLSQFPDQAELIHAALSQQKGESGQPTQSVAEEQPAVAAGPQVATRSSPEPLPEVPGYEVLERIGWGGMGVVWRCRDHVLPRYLAMKTLKEKYRKDANFSAFCCRLQREARVLGELQHPGIVPIHQSGTLPDGRPFFVMKLVQGRTLAQLLDNQGPGAARWLGVFAAVCQAMAYVHSEGVIHRDLKPANVMVGAFGEVQVMDLGLAKVLPCSRILRSGPMAVCPTSSKRPEDGTQTYVIPDESDDHTVPGSVMGTWEFMPPEQARGLADEADKRSDVFGLGAFLCAILTGQPPYVGATKEDVQRQARKADLTGVYKRLEACGADADLIELAKRYLAKEPDDRPQDAGEVAKEVAAYLADAEERAQKATVAQAVAEEKAKAERRERELAEEKARDERQARRRERRLTAGLAASVGLFLLALLAVVFINERAKQRQVADTVDKALEAAIGADLEAAEQAIEAAERAGASTGQVRMLRGQIALHRGQSQEAIRDLEQAVKLQPESVAALGMLAAAYADVGQWERYEKTIQVMAGLTPSTPEDFLFKGYAEGIFDPKWGLQEIKKALERRPRMRIAYLLRSEIRAYKAQDADGLEEAEGAVQDAGIARELLGEKNPAALWISLNAHLVKAGVHEHRAEPEERLKELKQAGKYADDCAPRRRKGSGTGPELDRHAA